MKSYILITESENILDKKLGKVFDPLYRVFLQTFDNLFNFCVLHHPETAIIKNTINNQKTE